MYVYLRGPVRSSQFACHVGVVQILHEFEEGEFIEEHVRDVHYQVFAAFSHPTQHKCTHSHGSKTLTNGHSIHVNRIAQSSRKSSKSNTNTTCILIIQPSQTFNFGVGLEC